MLLVAWAWRGAEDVEVFPGGGLVSGVPVFEVRLLGPVQAVRAGREVPLGGPRQRAVLALLVLEAGRVVLAERLIEELWRGSPPPGAAIRCGRMCRGCGRRWRRRCRWSRAAAAMR